MEFIKIKSKTILLLTLLLFSICSDAQNHKRKTKQAQKYQLLQQTFVNNKEDTIKSLKTAQEWLATAKQESNKEECVNAYKIILHYVPKKYRIIYADSLLQSAKATKNNETIAAAYVSVGAAHYNMNNHEKALDQYIRANLYAIKTNDPYLKHKIKYTIAQTKYQLEHYQEAIALFTDCLHFFKEENETAYLKTLHSLAMCYNLIDRYDLSAFNSQLGLQQSQEWENEEMIPYFESAEGINEYKLKNYETALKSLKKANIEIAKRRDYNTYALNLLYIGKCLWSKNQKGAAVAYFVKVDQMAMQQKLNRPNLRENYELLLQFYREQNDLDKKQLYVDKLLAFDKVASTQFKYTSYKVNKEYDTKQLLLEKQEIEKEMRNSQNINRISVAAFLAIIIGVVFWHIKSRKRQKKIFNKIMAEKTENKQHLIEEVEEGTRRTITISPEVRAAVLPYLVKFEKNKKYLDKDISLVKLAFYLQTNTKYTSLIIAELRGKKIPNYISDLKIDYIVEGLKNNSDFRKYTNKALAEEAGFGSTQIFTKAFIARMEISPTYFIRELKKGNSKQ